MKVVFSSAEEAKKFWNIVRSRRRRFIASLGVILWSAFNSVCSFLVVGFGSSVMNPQSLEVLMSIWLFSIIYYLVASAAVLVSLILDDKSSQEG